jgi:hypothetical protein
MQLVQHLRCNTAARQYVMYGPLDPTSSSSSGSSSITAAVALSVWLASPKDDSIVTSMAAAELTPGSGLTLIPLLTSVTFITPPLARDQDPFLVDGVETYCLWVLPITENERRHLRGAVGSDFGNRLASLLDANQHPYLLDPSRASYV